MRLYVPYVPLFIFVELMCDSGNVFVALGLRSHSGHPVAVLCVGGWGVVSGEGAFAQTRTCTRIYLHFFK